MNRRTIIAAAAAAAIGAGVVVALTGVSDARDKAPSDPVVRRLTVDPQQTSDLWSPERTRSARPRPLPEGP
jgi:hypothetical protein